MNGPTAEKAIKITAFPRLHLTLIGMNQNGYRINGGIGFAVDNPSLNIFCKAGDVFRVEDKRIRAISAAETLRIENLINYIIRQFHFSKSINVTIEGDAGSHIGLGTGTAIRLAIIEGLFLLNNCEVTDDLLIKLSKRGGTSGIGIYSYFQGGFILDLGRKNTNDSFSSSSQNESKTFDIPLALIKVPMPEWEFGLCIPQHIDSKTETEEKEFFNKVCPIPDHHVHETLYHATYGLAASILENNVTNFVSALKHLQNCSWKKSERSLYGAELLNLENQIYDEGALGVGMSSLGPGLFYLGNDIHQINSRIVNKYNNVMCFRAKAINHGRVIAYD